MDRALLLETLRTTVFALLLGSMILHIIFTLKERFTPMLGEINVVLFCMVVGLLVALILWEHLG